MQGKDLVGNCWAERRKDPCQACHGRCSSCWHSWIQPRALCLMSLGVRERDSPQERGPSGQPSQRAQQPRVPCRACQWRCRWSGTCLRAPRTAPASHPAAACGSASPRSRPPEARSESPPQPAVTQRCVRHGASGKPVCDAIDAQHAVSSCPRFNLTTAFSVTL